MVVIPSPEGFAAGMEHGRVGGSAIRVTMRGFRNVEVEGVDAGATLVVEVGILVMSGLIVNGSMPYIRIDGGDGLRLVGTVTDGEVEGIGAKEAEDIGIVVDIGT